MRSNIVKRIILIVLIVVMSMTLVACGQISSEKAISIALSDLGINRVAAASTAAELDESVSPAVYNVTIDRNTWLELYVIDAKTGEIISKNTVQK